MEVNPIKDIIEGFEEDFNQIVEEFSTNYPELKLSQFFKYWNNKSMDCLFANRFDPRELLEAITKMNQLLVRNIVTPTGHSDSCRVIALYFILCLFVKQPIRLRRKIRLTCDDVISIQKLSLSKIEDGKETDAHFAWRQLRALKAVDVVEERTIYGPSMLFDRRAKKHDKLDVDQSDERCDNTYNLDFAGTKLEPALIEVDSLCTSYEQIKETLQLDNYDDSMVDIQTSGTVREFIDRAKILLSLFKENS